MRNAHNQVNQKGNDGICPFPEHRGGQPQKKGHDGAHSSRADADENTDGQSGKSTVKHISSKPVRSKGVFQAGSQIRSGKVRGHSGFPAQDAAYGYRRQKNHGKAEQKLCPLSLIPSHFGRPPFRIRGSTAP